ncbi:phosphomannomutase, partial [Stenotrophomonas maltophilia]
ARHVVFVFIGIGQEREGCFPTGFPTPVRRDTRAATAVGGREQGAYCGIAWEGYFDGCFFFDHCGRLIVGYY